MRQLRTYVLSMVFLMGWALVAYAQSTEARAGGADSGTASAAEMGWFDALLAVIRENEVFSGLAAGSVIAAWTITTYFFSLRGERAWKRTEFMFAQLRILDTDVSIQQAIAVIEGWNPTVTVEAVFVGETSPLSPNERGIYLASFDRLLNLLWCVCYARLELKTITWTEAGGFGWYLWRVRSSPLIADYCRNSGYEQILDVADHLSISEGWGDE